MYRRRTYKCMSIPDYDWLRTYVLVHFFCLYSCYRFSYCKINRHPFALPMWSFNNYPSTYFDGGNKINFHPSNFGIMASNYFVFQIHALPIQNNNWNKLKTWYLGCTRLTPGALFAYTEEWRYLACEHMIRISSEKAITFVIVQLK